MWVKENLTGRTDASFLLVLNITQLYDLDQNPESLWVVISSVRMLIATTHIYWLSCYMPRANSSLCVSCLIKQHLLRQLLFTKHILCLRKCSSKLYSPLANENIEHSKVQIIWLRLSYHKMQSKNWTQDGLITKLMFLTTVGTKLPPIPNSGEVERNLHRTDLFTYVQKRKLDTPLLSSDCSSTHKCH